MGTRRTQRPGGNRVPPMHQNDARDGNDVKSVREHPVYLLAHRAA